jgi:hypothetical protein
VQTNIQSKPATLSFDNTEIAFKLKSNNELKQSYLLFKAIGYNWFVKLDQKKYNIWLKIFFEIPVTELPCILRFYNDFGNGAFRDDLNIPKDWWVIGFDTGHYGDTMERWPKEAVEAETKRLFCQLLDIELGGL